MIKITTFFDVKECRVEFELEPVRPFRIFEPEIGKEIAEKLPNYYVTKDGKISVVCTIGTDHTISRLREMQEDEQKEFSERIAQFKKKVDEFKSIQRIIKKQEA